MVLADWCLLCVVYCLLCVGCLLVVGCWLLVVVVCRWRVNVICHRRIVNYVLLIRGCPLLVVT